MPARLETFYNAACTLCRKPINGEGISFNYDPICLDCAVLISQALEGRQMAVQKGEEDKERQTVVCSNCGEKFTNRGQFLAHCKKCGKDYDGGLKAEVLA